MTPFGVTSNGVPVDCVTLTSADLQVKILTLGAILHDLRLAGVDGPLTLGSPVVAAYEGPLASFGSIVGPVANRIPGANAKLDGQAYKFETHPGTPDTLHSGSTGLQHQVWRVVDHGSDFLVLAVDLPDGLGGFPGNRRVEARYQLAGAMLRLTVTATTDAATWISLANHSYWALDGDLGFSGHSLKVAADQFTVTDAGLLPTGDLAPVKGGPFDFREGKVLSGDETQAFDFNLCLSDGKRPLRDVAWLTGRKGVRMTLATTEPGLQIYDCATIRAPGFATHHATEYGAYSGLALEAQAWPGATEHAHFPVITLRPGEKYEQITAWSFQAP